jgi:hypothetical protein
MGCRLSGWRGGAAGEGLDECSGPPAAGGLGPWIEGQPLWGLIEQSGDHKALDGWEVLAYLVAAVRQLVLMFRVDPRHGGQVDQELDEACHSLRREGKLRPRHDRAPSCLGHIPDGDAGMLGRLVRYGMSVGRWLGSPWHLSQCRSGRGVNVSGSG